MTTNSRVMSTLIDIEKAIEKLPQEDFHQLRRWIANRDDSHWDDEISRDAAAGRFDDLRRRITQDHTNGLCTEL